MVKYGGAVIGGMGILNGHEGSDFPSGVALALGVGLYVSGALLNDVIDCMDENMFSRPSSSKTSSYLS